MSGAPSRVRKTYRWIRKGAKRASSYGLLARYWVRNRAVRSSVLGDAAVTVSLTTYGTRIGRVAHTIESIAAGGTRPQRLVLWVDDEESFHDLPAPLRRLQARGLEVALTEDWGPHKKYYPVLASTIERATPLVTADDDVFYPSSWLSRLVRSAQRHPEEVLCYRASVVALEGGAIQAYARWPRCVHDNASLTHFATGVSGVYYPLPMLVALRAAGDRFTELCPRADDLWLHHVALRQRIPVRQVSPRPRHFPYIPGTQSQTLVSDNLVHGANDVYVARLYDESDVASLREAGALEV